MIASTNDVQCRHMLNEIRVCVRVRARVLQRPHMDEQTLCVSVCVCVCVCVCVWLAEMHAHVASARDVPSGHADVSGEHRVMCHVYDACDDVVWGVATVSWRCAESRMVPSVARETAYQVACRCVLVSASRCACVVRVHV